MKEISNWWWRSFALFFTKSSRSWDDYRKYKHCKFIIFLFISPSFRNSRRSLTYFFAVAPLCSLPISYICLIFCLSSSLLPPVFPHSLAPLPTTTACLSALFTHFLQVASHLQARQTESKPCLGLSWINKTRGPSINMRIHKELMGSWEWNPIHRYSRLSGVLYACLYLCVCCRWWWCVH